MCASDFGKVIHLGLGAARPGTLSTLLGLAMLLGGVTGCPDGGGGGGGGGIGSPCETAEECDNGDFCDGVETCSTNGEVGFECAAGVPPCPAEFCVENADFCPECTTNGDCDDGLFCNGVETCDPPEAGEVGLSCHDGASPCAEGEECNEEADRCETINDTDLAAANPDVDLTALVAGEPVTLTAPAVGAKTSVTAQAAGCACAWSSDGPGTFDPVTACTTAYTPALGDTQITVFETCASGFFVFNADVTVTEVPPCAEDGECDDGVFCNGPETCVEGSCQTGAAPCAEGECDEERDECGQPCTSDADCDDELFCNGDETCGTNGFCMEGTPPCDEETEECEEGAAGADCVPLPVQSLNFTLNQDNLLGTAADDTFSAPLATPSGGQQAPMLQNLDRADGLAGTDTINASLINNSGTAATLAPTLTGIEVFNLSEFGGTATTTFSGVNVTGATTFNSSGSLANVTITNLGALANLGVINSDFDLNVSFIAPAGNTGADALTLTLNGSRDSDPVGATGSAVNITTPAAGVETLNLVSTGATANVLEALNQVTGMSMTTLAISGSTGLTIRRNAPLPATLTTINASSATGPTDLTVGGALNVTYTGGSGNDVVNFAGTYTTADTINGGTGTNTIGVNSAQAVGLAANQTNVTNFQTVLIPDSLNGALDVSRFAANDAILDTTAAATTLLGGASTITLSAGSRTVTLNNDDTGANTLGVTISGAGGTDALALNLNNADLGAALTLTGAEPVNLTSGNGLDATAADGSANTATAITVTPTAPAVATLNILGPVSFQVSGAITAATINAGSAGAAFQMGTTTVAAAGATITGSPFNDTLIGSASNDSIVAGDGNDTVRGEGGVDATITLGNGNDTLRINALAASGADRKTVTDFDDTAGTGDVLSLDANVGGASASQLSGTDNFTTAASIQGHGAGGALAVAAATEVVRVTSATVTNFTDANSLNGTNLLTAIGGAITVQAVGNQHLFVVADAGGNEGVYYGDAGADNAIAAGELTLIAVLQGANVVLNDLVFNNFANN